ncbi:uncharacterized protein LOC130366974 isoform X4 [Hyla sarda]|uniref:uncharacterized protein LOC130366974 isoform X4 n=1 Tax=Hyla sarda TaxID=327740 RepID=UPI0024C2A154|nr:uncharacterized protein LOC130366974 isoform X4 [Hyla sarda]
MGVYASKFNESGGRTLLESTDPSQANWITAHAETCKMSITEVQRCWSRFIMLDPDHNGNVKRSHFLSTDEFGKKLCQQIPIGNDEVITFQAYCSAVSWLANSPQESKIRGAIDEDQFVSWVHTIPHEKVTSSLQFPIIPLEVMSEPEKELSSVPTNINMEDKWRIRDDQLQQVASLMEKRKRDWRLLANNLGFLEKDCVFFEQNHSEIRDKILDMLQVWRNARGKQAQTEVLQKALRKTNNADIANDIFNLNF